MEIPVLTVSKHIKSFHKEELEAIVLGIVDALYLAPDGKVYDPEKEWNSDTFGRISDVVYSHNLIPQYGEHPVL